MSETDFEGEKMACLPGHLGIVPAEDAVHVDSTAHTIDEVVRIIEDLINQRR